MNVKKCLVWIAIITLLNSISFAGIKVGIMYNDEEINVLRNGLLPYDDFAQIDLIPWSSPPDPASIANYDSVIVTERYKPVANSKMWGNIIADYAEAGGGVVLSWAFFSTGGMVVDYGKLADALHTPFARGPIVAGDDSLGSILLPSNPLMNGVNELTTHYRYGVTVNPGATLVASFKSGIPLAGFMAVGSGRVVGIQADYILNRYFTNEGDYMQLYRNAVVYSVPEPATLVLLALGGAAMVRKRQRGHGQRWHKCHSVTRISINS